MLDAPVNSDHHNYIGVGYGLILGDALCAPFEGGPLERALWWMIGSTRGKRRYTDDSQMAFDLGNHLLRTGQIDQQSLLRDFADSYRWSRGYGPSTVSVLKAARRCADWHAAATSRHSNGSYGNGAAMRVPILSVFLHGRVNANQLLSWVKQSAEVTHPNPLAIDGATAIALSVFYALDGLSTIDNVVSVAGAMNTSVMRERMETVAEWLAKDMIPSVRHAKTILGAGTAAIESCPVAIYLALKNIGNPFGALIQDAITGGGDTDTIGAMAGAIWGAYHGDTAMPPELVTTTEGIDSMTQLILRLRDRHPVIAAVDAPSPATVR